MADLHDLRAGARLDGGRDLLREARAGVVPAEALGIGPVEDGEAHVRVEPSLRIEHELGVGGEPGGQREAACLRDLAEAVEWTKRFLAVLGAGECRVRPVF